MVGGVASDGCGGVGDGGVLGLGGAGALGERQRAATPTDSTNAATLTEQQVREKYCYNDSVQRWITGANHLDQQLRADTSVKFEPWEYVTQ